MIREIHIENVRIFEGTGWTFPIRPLTVFCGTNSAGKSTLLKTLPLLSQSMGIHENYIGPNGIVRFSGPETDLGGFSSYVSHNDRSRPLVLSITTDDHLSRQDLSFLRSRADESARPASGDSSTVPILLTSRFEFRAVPVTPDGQGALPFVDAPAAMSGPHSRARYGDHARLQLANFIVRVGREPLLRWTVHRVPDPERAERNDYVIRMPKDYFGKVGGFNLLDVPSDPGEFITLRTDLRGLLPRSITGRRKFGPKDARRADASQGERLFRLPLPPLMEGALDRLLDTLRNLHYIAPLRAPAKRYYVAQHDLAPEMDPAGEFLPYILKEMTTREQLAMHIGPGGTEIVQEPLSVAVSSWMYYLRTGRVGNVEECRSEISVTSTKRVLVEVQVRTVDGGELHSMADSGFGYSQVLPILVRALLAKTGSTLLIEQPELHLNPALQVRLSEFLVNIVRSGKQVIVETHSEHIVNAIRVLSAEDETGRLSEASLIFFIDAENLPPHVYNLNINPDGTVPDWPSAFFGEAISLGGRLLRAQKRFRKGVQSR